MSWGGENNNNNNGNNNNNSSTPFSFHCMICFEEFDPNEKYPVVLPCGHTYVCNCCANRIQVCMECREPLYTMIPKNNSHGQNKQQQHGAEQTPRSGSSSSRHHYQQQQQQQPKHSNMMKKRLPLPKNVVLLSLIEATELASEDARKKFGSSPDHQHHGGGGGSVGGGGRGSSPSSDDEWNIRVNNSIIAGYSDGDETRLRSMESMLDVEDREEEKIKMGTSLFALGSGGTYACAARQGLEIFPYRPGSAAAANHPTTNPATAVAASASAATTTAAGRRYLYAAGAGAGRDSPATFPGIDGRYSNEGSPTMSSSGDNIPTPLDGSFLSATDEDVDTLVRFFHTMDHQHHAVAAAAGAGAGGSAIVDCASTGSGGGSSGSTVAVGSALGSGDVGVGGNNKTMGSQSYHNTTATAGSGSRSGAAASTPARLSFGDRVQVVTIESSWAKLARGYGFVRADNNQLVKVGGPVDRSCKLEAMLRTLSIRRNELRLEQNKIDNQFIGLMNELQVSLQNDEDLTVILADAFTSPPTKWEEEEEKKLDSSSQDSPSDRQQQQQQHRNTTTTTTNTDRQQHVPQTPSKRQVIQQPPAEQSIHDHINFSCFTGEVFSSSDERESNRQQFLRNITFRMASDDSDEQRERARQQQQQQQQDRRQEEDQQDDRNPSSLVRAASHPSPSMLAAGAQAWREQNLQQQSSSGVDFRTGMSGHLALLSNHAHPHEYLASNNNNNHNNSYYNPTPTNGGGGGGGGTHSHGSSNNNSHNNNNNVGAGGGGGGNYGTCHRTGGNKSSYVNFRMSSHRGLSMARPSPSRLVALRLPSLTTVRPRLLSSDNSTAPEQQQQQQHPHPPPTPHPLHQQVIHQAGSM